ncbi:TonB-dependent receptor [Algibacillus agarilyticus]|uniref:TonB-dependent receptor n=1 Tax=Algibacillus agarilyticus TaxID=2234133 RepID=UPI000DCF7B08|nr:TonB-dependent receptor [Algibacillus agarilyticus]
MSYTRNNYYKLSALTLAILSSGLNAYAAEEAAQNQSATDETETIEVIGFKGSVLKSMFEKRNSGNVTDSIFAEDIGKSTDQNIADALSRVTGVSVQSSDGEGTKITVRGANPDQNMISLNGVQLTSTDFNQSVDLSAFSSDVLSHINVVKTPSADHDEGSLGATILLNTTKPLDVKNDITSLTLQGRYSDFSENANYKIAGTISRKFWDDRFGVLFTGYNETNSVRRDQMFVDKFEARDVTVARDLDGNIINNTRAITPSALEYSLFENDRDRHGGTLSFQVLPTDSTNITLDLTYSRQEVTDTKHGIKTRFRPSLFNYEEGVLNSERADSNEDNYPTYSDPQVDWWVVDTDTNTIIKSLHRFGDGGMSRTNGGNITTNKVANLGITQYITDDFKVDVGLNISDTVLEPLNGGTVNMSLLNGNGVHNQVKARADAYGTPHTGIQPVGFDCSAGPCEMIFGDGFVSLNNPDNPYDNIGRSAFNPDDMNSQTINWMNLVERQVEDTQKTAFIDFDWDVDFVGITKIEFGVKYSEREKYVDDQNKQFRNTKQPIQITKYDSEGSPIGLKAIIAGENINSVPADNFLSDEAFPYDDFMSDIGISRNNATDGWDLLSEQKLLALAYGNEDAELFVDDSATRRAELENSAAYIKFSFNPIERLTGDVGVRYVKTDLTTYGNSGAEFTADPLDRIFDPFMWRQLRNLNLAECTNKDTFAPNDNRAENRIDGTAWDRNGTPDDYTDDTRIEMDPAGYPCYDERTTKNSGENGAWWNARHQDISTLNRNVFTDDPAAVRDDHLRTFSTVGTNTYDMYLPSLNLNYQVSDDLITRFAVSKTMSRPNIDSLKPGFKLKEGYWGDPTTPRGSSLRLNNPKLLPQESQNLDLSVEWYFNDSSMMSAALFRKSMTNFEESEEQIVFTDDLRTINLEDGYDLANLIKTEEQIRDFIANDETGTGFGACMPKRGNISDVTKDWWYSDDMLDHCALFKASKVRNGKGATITGIELQYAQSYDFLPGFLSGLGSTINYTYQESKTDKEYSSIIPTLELPEFPSAWTPKHSYNATVYWEQNGHQVRLAYRGKSDELMNRSWSEGAKWREGSGTFDLSANYKINDNISASLQVINLTDEVTRNYYTSRTLDLGETQLNDAGEVIGKDFDEGNALDGDVTTSRTQELYKTGRIFRLGLRVNF